MSSPVKIDAAARERAHDWQVRSARTQDAPAIAAAVSRLLLELGGTPPPAAAMEASAVEILGDETAGAVLLAEADRALVGILAVSWQKAIHVPGRYALIQDLWVDQAWRSRSVGEALIAALCRLAREQNVSRLEVGLPRAQFAGLASTTAFYRREGFMPLGSRMRRMLT